MFNSNSLRSSKINTCIWLRISSNSLDPTKFDCPEILLAKQMSTPYCNIMTR